MAQHQQPRRSHHLALKRKVRILRALAHTRAHSFKNNRYQHDHVPRVLSLWHIWFKRVLPDPVKFATSSDPAHRPQKLQKGEEEDIAGTYFKPKRANELLVRFQDDANTLGKCPPWARSTLGQIFFHSLGFTGSVLPPLPRMLRMRRYGHDFGVDWS